MGKPRLWQWGGLGRLCGMAWVLPGPRGARSRGARRLPRRGEAELQRECFAECGREADAAGVSGGLQGRPLHCAGALPLRRARIVPGPSGGECSMGGPGGAPSPTRLMPFPPSPGVGGWFSSAEASKHGHPPQIQLEGACCPHVDGFLPVPPSHRAPQDRSPRGCSTSHPAGRRLPAAPLTLSPADAAAEEAGRQLACWGHGDALESYYIKCFIYIISYYIMPWSWQGLAW